MSKRALFYTNILLAVAAVLQIGSGLLLGLFDFKPAEEIHEVVGYVFAVLVVAHVAQNWGWIRSQLRRA